LAWACGLILESKGKQTLAPPVCLMPV